MQGGIIEGENDKMGEFQLSSLFLTFLSSLSHYHLCPTRKSLKGSKELMGERIVRTGMTWGNPQKTLSTSRFSLDISPDKDVMNPFVQGINSIISIIVKFSNFTLV